MKNSWSVPVIVVVVVLGVLCCCGLVAVVTGGVVFFNLRAVSTPFVTEITQLPFLNTPVFNTPEPSILPTQVPPQVQVQTQSPTTNTEPVSPAALETLKTLNEAEVPINDLADLARRLQGKENIPPTLPAPSSPLKVGATTKFWVTNTDTNENSQVSATLSYVTPHLYFWVQNGVQFNQDDLKTLAETFENKIYPTDREFFGSEWSPGVDSDVHLYILYARNLGSNLAGYFSSADEYNPEVHKYSNAHEMFMLNADNLSLGEQYVYSTLAHEFQHMIHWYTDRNEESWLNEGFSELAAFLNGYDVGGFDALYMSNPDLQLNDWPNDQNATAPHYGAAFLYLTYFLDRFGQKATQAVVASPLNGLVSIDAVLADEKATDPVTHKQITADDVFADWAVTNFLLDKSVGDGRYTYSNYPNAPQAGPTETITNCPTSAQDLMVHQYGVQYIAIDCSGKFNLNFQGSTEVGVIPEGAHSGNYAFWSNKGDESDMTLTRSFDFTSVSGPLEMDYWTWYDVEKDYDYVYLEASTDGQSWQIIKTPSCSDTDPSGNAYGCGYNGASNGWIQEHIDLSKYAGEKVQLRFEYVTDAAVNGEGFLLDDVSIPAVNYSTDFEKDDGGWQAAGFVRIQNTLPQTFRVSLILKGATTTVQPVELDDKQSATVSLDLGGDVQEAVVVISGTTRFTRQEAAYSLSVSR